MWRFRNFLNYIFRALNQLRRPTKARNKRLMQKRGESLDSFKFRDATEADLPALAELHVKTWNDTYNATGKPAATTIKLRESQWREQFKKGTDDWFCIVIENSNGDLVGFAKGIMHSSDYKGELNKIYLLREYQRLGLGRKLAGHVVRRFINKGMTKMVLFGIPQNPSCKFHEAIGGERLVKKGEPFHGGYIWRDLDKLAAICPV